MPEAFKNKNYTEYDTLTDELVAKADVMYQTRVQAERFNDKNEYERVKDAFILDKTKLNGLKESAILLHPLPRVNELPEEVDALEQAWYFRQAANGVPARMALFEMFMG